MPIAIFVLVAALPTMAFAALPFPDIDPVALQLGPLAIRWYGLAYVVGIVLGWRYARALASNDRLWGGRSPFTAQDMDDLLTWVAVGVIAGGKIGYNLLYQPGAILENPLNLVAVWQPGMSFHGGMLGTILAMVLFARSRGLPVWSTLDTVAAAVPIGLFFGRIANFINSELWGRPTELAWGVVFPNGGPDARHPTQLYEAALEGVVLFIVLRWLTHSGGSLALRHPGRVGGAFVAGYGIFRTFIEFVRVPDEHIGYLTGGWVTIGMLYSVPMILAGGWAYWSSGRRQLRLPAAA